MTITLEDDPQKVEESKAALSQPTGAITHVGDIPVPLFSSQRGGTVHFRIDQFAQRIGILEIIIHTIPFDNQDRARDVYRQWVNHDSFYITLMGDAELPLTIAGHRYPAKVGRIGKTKETGRALDPKDKTTWTSDLLIRGSEACAKRGICEHFERGQAKCPPPVELGSSITGAQLIEPLPSIGGVPVDGVIRHNREVWILRLDGPPVEASKLEQARALEHERNNRINDRLENRERLRREATLLPGAAQPRIIQRPEEAALDARDKAAAQAASGVVEV